MSLLSERFNPYYAAGHGGVNWRSCIETGADLCYNTARKGKKPKICCGGAAPPALRAGDTGKARVFRRSRNGLRPRAGSCREPIKEKEVEHDNELQRTAHPGGNEKSDCRNGLYRDDRDPAEGDPGAAGREGGHCEGAHRHRQDLRLRCADGRAHPAGKGLCAGGHPLPHPRALPADHRGTAKAGEIHPWVFHRGGVRGSVDAAADQRPEKEPADRGGDPRPADGPYAPPQRRHRPHRDDRAG